MAKNTPDTIVNKDAPKKESPKTKKVYFVGLTQYGNNLYQKCDSYEATEEELKILSSITSDCLDCAKKGISMAAEICEECL